LTDEILKDPERGIYAAESSTETDPGLNPQFRHLEPSAA
jgi:hypothetical protein